MNQWLEWKDKDVDTQTYLEHLTKSVRNTAIEECARVAETYAKDLWPTATPRAECAAAIRALKDK